MFTRMPCHQSDLLPIAKDLGRFCRVEKKVDSADEIVAVLDFAAVDIDQSDVDDSVVEGAALLKLVDQHQWVAAIELAKGVFQFAGGYVLGSMPIFLMGCSLAWTTSLSILPVEKTSQCTNSTKTAVCFSLIPQQEFL